MTMFYDSAKSREYTCRLLEAVDEGLVDPEAALRACLGYMSESDVEDMMRSNDMLPEEEYEDEVEDDLDPMEDYNYVGHPMHY